MQLKDTVSCFSELFDYAASLSDDEEGGKVISLLAYDNPNVLMKEGDNLELCKERIRKIIQYRKIVRGLK